MPLLRAGYARQRHPRRRSVSTTEARLRIVDEDCRGAGRARRNPPRRRRELLHLPPMPRDKERLAIELRRDCECWRSVQRSVEEPIRELSKELTLSPSNVKRPKGCRRRDATGSVGKQPAAQLPERKARVHTAREPNRRAITLGDFAVGSPPADPPGRPRD